MGRPNQAVVLAAQEREQFGGVDALAQYAPFFGAASKHRDVAPAASARLNLDAPRPTNSGRFQKELAKPVLLHFFLQSCSGQPQSLGGT